MNTVSIKFLKEDSGAKGLYGQQGQKEVIELSKPEVLRVISEFENVFYTKSNAKDSLEHPESSAAEQNKFLKHLKVMCDLASEGKVVNPFRETGPELITLDMGEVIDPEIALSLKEAVNIGNSNFTECVVTRIEKATKPLSDVIQRSNLFTFTNRPPTDLNKGTDKLGSSKANTASSQKCLCRYKHVPTRCR